MNDQTRAPRIRNIIIFSLISALAGWIGLALNNALGLTDPTQNLGMLVFLLLPPLTSVLLRAFGGDGWKDIGWRLNLRGNINGYLISLLVLPIIILLVLLIGLIADGTSFEGLAANGTMTVLGAVGLMFAADFFKNIFEEFSWRGYLTPRLQAAGFHDLTNHILTGAVWAFWHIPYWLFLLDKATYQNFTSVSMAVFLPLSIISIIVSAILYGEVRLWTGSTWAAVLLHTSGNAVTLALLLNDFIEVNPATEIWFTPGGGGVIGIILTGLAGLGLYAYRMRMRST